MNFRARGQNNLPESWIFFLISFILLFTTIKLSSKFSSFGRGILITSEVLPWRLSTPVIPEGHRFNPNHGMLNMLNRSTCKSGIRHVINELLLIVQ